MAAKEINALIWNEQVRHSYRLQSATFWFSRTTIKWMSFNFSDISVNMTFQFMSLPHKQGAGIATGYGLDYRVFRARVPVRSRIFSSPRRPDRLWGPPSLLSNRYWNLFPRG
jgi:hypothetical protein